MVMTADKHAHGGIRTRVLAFAHNGAMSSPIGNGRSSAVAVLKLRTRVLAFECHATCSRPHATTPESAIPPSHQSLPPRLCLPMYTTTWEESSAARRSSLEVWNHSNLSQSVGAGPGRGSRDSHCRRAQAWTCQTHLCDARARAFPGETQAVRHNEMLSSHASSEANGEEQGHSDQVTTLATRLPKHVRLIRARQLPLMRMIHSRPARRRTLDYWHCRRAGLHNAYPLEHCQIRA
jgi:hypothetical protein